MASRRLSAPKSGSKASKPSKGSKFAKAGFDNPKKNRWSDDDRRVRGAISASRGKPSRRDFEESLPSDRHQPHPDEPGARFERSARVDDRGSRPRFDRNDDRRGGFNRDDRGGERRSFNRDERPRRFEDRND
ncbi:MAG: hypothetical protein ACRDAX_09870, partial [Propionibacteriaceae bacterium]